MHRNLSLRTFFTMAVTAGNLGGGVLWHHTSATTTRVTFAAKANMANDDAPTTDWPSDAYFRVKKAKASSPVGFGVASVANGFGLVAARKGSYSYPAFGQTGGITGTNLTSYSLAKAIYYQDQDGNHRLKLNLNLTYTSTSNPSFILTGVTFTSAAQALSAFGNAAGDVIAVACSGNGGSTVFTATASAITNIRISGDVELASKPTWA